MLVKLHTTSYMSDKYTDIPLNTPIILNFYSFSNCRLFWDERFEMECGVGEKPQQGQNHANLKN